MVHNKFTVILRYFDLWHCDLCRKLDNSFFENSPLLILKDGEINHDNLKKTRITKADSAAKLREANVLKMSNAKAVIFESTGDISVLHSGDEVDEFIMKNVRT